MEKNPRPEHIHRSVLLEETLHYLNPVSGGTYVDGTMGMGGHSLAILERSAPSGQLITFEWDEAAIEQSAIRLSEHTARYKVIRRNFAEIAIGLEEAGVESIDGLLIDIGLSSLQLDQGNRGFTFRKDEPLDMRMDTRREETAATILSRCSEEELADIFYYYGDEKQARPMAAAIVEKRKTVDIETSGQLADILYAAVPKRFHPKRIHVATKVFQALRIAVNRELENLAQILEDAVPFLKPGACFCVISFHSLEDRMVKRKFKEHDELSVVTSKPVIATEGEIVDNPRSRSAKLRVAKKK